MVLNGSSSAGKTAIARQLQSLLPGSWLLFGVDLLLWTMPSRLFGSDPEGLSIRDGVISRGDEFMRLYAGFQHAVAGLAATGVDVVIDDAMLGGRADQQLWDAALAAHDVCWIGVRCAPDVVDAREAARGDRAPGTARAQIDLVHRGVAYDFEVDTTELDARSASRLVAEHLRDRWSLERVTVAEERPFYPLTSAWTAEGEIRPPPWEVRPAPPTDTGAVPP